MLMVPKMTRLAFLPLIGTGAACPRRDHAARNGGNNNRSVSSSKRTTLREGRFLSRWRSFLFFLLVRVGRQHETRALPDVAQLMQSPTNGVPRQPTSIP